MKKPFMEVIRFDSSDVILTSGAHTLNGYTVHCPAGHNEDGAYHFLLEEIKIDPEDPDLSYAGGLRYRNNMNPPEVFFPYTSFTDGLPTQADIGKWYYRNGDYQFELCNSGK